MSCSGTVPGGTGSVDLEKELIDSNLRVMAIQTGFLDQVGGTVQFGKRVDLFLLFIPIAWHQESFIFCIGWYGMSASI